MVQFLPMANQHIEDELGLIGGVWRGKKQNKKNASKRFSKSVCQMMMKRANSAASWCSAFYFIQFVEFFYWRKNKLVQIVLSSRKPELHKQHALKTSEDTWPPPPWKVGIREKCSFKQCLERSWAMDVLKVMAQTHCQSSLQSVVFLWYTAQHFRARSPTVRAKLTTYLTKQRFQTAPVLLPIQGKAHTCLSKKITSKSMEQMFLSLSVN